MLWPTAPRECIATPPQSPSLHSSETHGDLSSEADSLEYLTKIFVWSDVAKHEVISQDEFQRIGRIMFEIILSEQEWVKTDTDGMLRQQYKEGLSVDGEMGKTGFCCALFHLVERYHVNQSAIFRQLWTTLEVTPNTARLDQIILMTCSIARLQRACRSWLTGRAAKTSALAASTALQAAACAKSLACFRGKHFEQDCAMIILHLASVAADNFVSTFSLSLSFSLLPRYPT